MNKTTLTLAIPASLKKEMRGIRGVNWSEETRCLLEDRIKRLKLLQELDELTKHSSLTEEDVIEIGRKIKAGVARRHGIRV